MAVLHNRVSQEELKQRLMEETEKRVTISFYQYFPIVDPRAFIPSQFATAEGPNVEGFWYDSSYAGVKAATGVADTSARLVPKESP